MLVIGLQRDYGWIDLGDWKTFHFPLDVLSSNPLADEDAAAEDEYDYNVY